jgi:penicillin-binding protein 1A
MMPVLKWTATLSIWATVLLAGAVAWYAYDLPDVDKFLAASRRPTVTVLGADNSVLAAVGDLYGTPVRLRDLPPALPHAVIATEDRRFYGHFGIDPIGLARAVWVNLRAGAIVQGGSTITQQVAKNLFLTPERTVKRKAQEVLLALWLEHRFTKDQILTVYLHRVYLGAGTYGVEAASRKYFGRSARRVSTYQAAMLAGLLKAPARYNPSNNPDRAAKRTAQVLVNMVDAGYLTPAQAAAARRDKARAVALKRHRDGRHFVDWILDQVPSYVAPGNRDLTVHTTLNPRLQRLAEARVGTVLAQAGAKAGVSEAALVAIAPDGAVRAMVGGRDYRKSQFNRATQALRQPGSAFKPLVYLAGLEAGLTPESRLLDAPVTVDGWQPRNFVRRHVGEVTLRRALSESINTVAVRVAEQAGRKRVVEAARRLGITSTLKAKPSLALGTAEVRLVDLTAAYAAFANGGMGVWAYGIQAIRDGKGRVLYRRAGSGPGRVMTPAHVAAMNAMLADVIASGTGRAARLARPVAGKTGTSQNFRDAWFMGYSADLVTGVWMGNDDGRPMLKVTGGGLPAILWRDFMAAALKGTPVHPLPGLAPHLRPGAPEEGFWKRLIANVTGNEG